MTLKVIFLSILLTIAYAEAFFLEPHTRRNSNLSSQSKIRIVDGEDAQIGEFPYLVSLYHGDKEDSLKHNCGGSIITKDWILTAAHCIRQSDNKILIVKAGKHDLSKTEDSEQIREVAERIVHEKFEGEVLPYDIGLLKLKTPLDLNDRVSIIDLPKSGVEHSEHATIAGWGSVSKTYDKEFPDILKKAEVPIFDREACQKKSDDPVDVTNICTGTNHGGSGTCQGDSGGPLVSDKQVIGISSWVVMPCGFGISIFTNVTVYIDWISNHISNNASQIAL